VDTSKFIQKDRRKLSLILLLILFPMGFIFHQVAFTRPYVLGMTDIFLLATNSLVFYFLWKEAGSVKLLAWSILSFISTFLLEFIGVKTGLVFGNYHYGSTMFLQLGKVPVVIAFNWIILILATFSLSLKITGNRWHAPIAGSLMIVVFDYIMEPVAMHLDYWQWDGNIIPFQNYAAWFLISLVFSYGLAFFRIHPDSWLLRWYFIIQLGFFLLFRLEMMI
jgi:putative membrane protein